MQLKIDKIKIIETTTNKYGEYAFHSGVNIIEGTNKVGKSSLIKSIMHTVGFEIKKWDKSFRKEKMIFILDLSFEGRKINIIRYLDDYIINGNFYSLEAYRMKIRDYFDLEFDLLQRNTSNPIVPYPSDLFLYNYIDQDDSWGSPIFLCNHKSQMFKPIELKNVFYYYLGITNFQVNRLDKEIKDLEKEIKLLEDNKDKLKYTKDILNKEVEKQISINKEDFEYEIDQLEKRINKVYVNKNKSEYEILKLMDELKDIEVGIKELEMLYDDLVKIDKNTKKYHCKTCNSEINKNMFIKKYNIENDKNSILGIYSSEIKKRKKITEKLEKEKGKLKLTANDLIQLEDLFMTKKNEITFQNVIESYGNTENSKKIDALVEKINSDITFKKDEKKIKKNLKDKEEESIEKRKTEVKELYSKKIDEISLVFKDIDLHTYKEKFMEFKTENETGSELNILQIILFYIYFYLLSEKAEKVLFPFIWDSVLKETLDENNYVKVSKFINEKVLTLNNQIIFSFVKDGKDIALSDDFKQRITLESEICNIEMSKEDEKIIDNIMEVIKNS